MILLRTGHRLLLVTIFFMAHKLPGDEGCISVSEILPPRSQRLPCFYKIRQHIGSLIHKSPVWPVFAPSFQTGMPDSALIPGYSALGESSQHPWVPK